MLLFHRPRSGCDRLAEAFSAERRLSEKRLRLIESQANEIDRLVAQNARLAALLLHHHDCPFAADSEALLGSLIGQHGR